MTFHCFFVFEILLGENHGLCTQICEGITDCFSGLYEETFAFGKKTMWILLVIFGFVSPGMTVFAGGFRLFCSIGWIFAYSAVICYGSGTIMIRLMLPVGAVCYFFMRRSLLEEKPSAVVICETTPLSPEEEEN